MELPGEYLLSSKNNKIRIIKIGPTGEKLCVSMDQKNIRAELRTFFFL